VSESEIVPDCSKILNFFYFLHLLRRSVSAVVALEAERGGFRTDHDKTYVLPPQLLTNQLFPKAQRNSQGAHTIPGYS
jgi:hypothetical protein